MAEIKQFFLDKEGLGQYDALIKQYIADIEITKVLYADTASWNSQPQLVSQVGVIYIYSDYKKDAEGNNIPGLKVGDGNAYLIDVPFLTKLIDEHILDNIRHITSSERDSWNNKVTCYIDVNNSTRLVFSKD